MLDADSEFQKLLRRSEGKLCEWDSNEKVEKLVEIPPSFGVSVKQEKQRRGESSVKSSRLWIESALSRNQICSTRN